MFAMTVSASPAGTAAYIVRGVRTLRLSVWSVVMAVMCSVLLLVKDDGDAGPAVLEESGGLGDRRRRTAFDPREPVEERADEHLDLEGRQRRAEAVVNA